MKELSIEEKARAYDNVREKIAVRFGSNVAKEIFSEYEESEDEKVRKEILNYLYDVHDDDEERARWIAWFEKQGEQKPAEEYNITGIGSKNAQGKLGEMIKNLKPINKVLDQKPVEKVEQKAWSEEDDYTLLDTIGILRSCGRCSTDRKLWLLSLKKRVQPQPKQEWSEEDEKMLNQVIEDIVKLAGPYVCYHKDVDFLKSLKDRYTWKPSGEQIEALKYSTYCPNEQMSKVLFELYQDLKKLREE